MKNVLTSSASDNRNAFKFQKKLIILCVNDFAQVCYLFNWMLEIDHLNVILASWRHFNTSQLEM